MGTLHSQESAYAQEMRKWNAHHSEYGPPMRPFEQKDYPMAMYRMDRKPDGTRYFLPMEVAQTEVQRTELERRGYTAGGQGKALEAFELRERDYAELAAERAYDVKHRLSDKAGAEVEAIEAASGAKHLPTIERAPVRRRQPRRKPAAPPQEA